jgi:hypothetical protein
MGRICKNDFASPLQPSEHTHVSQLFEKRKVGFLHAMAGRLFLGGHLMAADELGAPASTRLQ